MNEQTNPVADVGVVVGRFQVDELHEAHQELIQNVVDNYPKVIIFLGLSATKCTINNPLDFESRKQMILQSFPNVNVLYIKDVPDDKIWSTKLDDAIDDIKGPTQSVILLGGRDAFISHYKGKYDTYELIQETFVSGKEIRKIISNKVKSSSDFRKGVIWATMNQWPQSIATVDVALITSDFKRVLLARKTNETLYRFVGGFVEPNYTLEDAIKKEVIEETGLEVSDPIYLKSFVIDDWRYRSEKNKITTSLFVSTIIYGRPTPMDDICELKYFDIKTLIAEDLVKEHRQMLPALFDYILDQNDTPPFDAEAEEKETQRLLINDLLGEKEKVWDSAFNVLNDIN